MKLKWYLQTWFISLCFTLSILIVPLILGIILLLLHYKEVKKQSEFFNNDERYQAANLEKTVQKLEREIEKLEKEKEDKTLKFDKQMEDRKSELEVVKKEIIDYEEEVAMQSFGFHDYKYVFGSSELYKAKLNEIRQKQKDMVKDDIATESKTWTVDGNKRKGESLRKENVKLVLRAFNQECDTAISKVKFNNLEIVKKQILKAFEQLNKNSKNKGVMIKVEYLDLKFEELILFHEHQVKKEEEREEQRQIREQMREEKKVQDEIKKERKKLEKDEKHFTNAFEKYKKQLEEANTEIHIEIEKKMAEIKLQLEKIKKEKEVVDYREQNARAGYVYIISNIGSFGENIYKIGMTRRLEPMERINELGSASVPFNFDVHAMIFSDDAPDLENKLHKAFINKQVNKVNTRKEFFDVTLEEIVEVVENNFDKTVEFTKIAEAEDYRKSLKISEGKIDEGTNVIAS
ncbi:DUF4041 domain-containing protein [Oceanobacillus kimchii]|uniref:DUF4041 domain-containing protein n=2 Tax=Oceanobacillus kimchii TaxID=746691 RepID=UPI00034AAB13|nr:DUF4041 domain-containing protein [Oceanobacillus kimchii]MCT1576570.1 DUF4041 domain-containing protein [Oceanobacillus kimchii]MCT2136206.1 DUF4041 domain-containing protein [Oceanobacillus kimchii]